MNLPAQTCPGCGGVLALRNHIRAGWHAEQVAPRVWQVVRYQVRHGEAVRIADTDPAGRIRVWWTEATAGIYASARNGR